VKGQRRGDCPALQSLPPHPPLFRLRSCVILWCDEEGVAAVAAPTAGLPCYALDKKDKWTGGRQYQDAMPYSIAVADVKRACLERRRNMIYTNVVCLCSADSPSSQCRSFLMQHLLQLTQSPATEYTVEGFSDVCQGPVQIYLDGAPPISLTIRGVRYR
jgi:hypothetical protein